MPALKVVAKKRLSVSLAPQRILASALASQRIEGLELDTRAAAEFSALAAGKMNATDLRQRLLNRYAKLAGTN